MMKLVSWHGQKELMNQEEIDDEKSQEVDSRDEVMQRSVIFRVEWVGGRARVTTDKERVLQEGWREIKSYR